MTVPTRFAVGDRLADLDLPPLTLATLQAYAEASGDHAAVHLDGDVARSFGFPDAIAHGLLVMAWLGRVVGDAVPPDRLKSFSARFAAPVLVGDLLTCSGRVEAVEDGLARIALSVVDGAGSVKIDGKAIILAAGDGAL